MKKKIIIGIIILLAPFLVKAEGKITRDSLYNGFKEMITCMENENQTTKTITRTNANGEEEEIEIPVCKDEMDYSLVNVDDYIAVTDDAIIIYKNADDHSDANATKINYIIQDNNDVLFNESFTIDNTTTFENFKEIFTDKISEDEMDYIFGYIALGRALGVSIFDIEDYIYQNIFANNTEGVRNLFDYDYLDDLETLDENGVNYITLHMDNDIRIEESEFPNYAVEFAKLSYGLETKTFNDSSNKDTISISIVPDASDDSKFVISIQVLAKSSKIMEQFDITENSFLEVEASKNSLDPLEDVTTTGEEQGETKDTSTVENPKTGYYLSIISVIVLVFAGLILLAKSKNYFKKI